MRKLIDAARVGARRQVTVQPLLDELSAKVDAKPQTRPLEAGVRATGGIEWPKSCRTTRTRPSIRQAIETFTTTTTTVPMVDTSSFSIGSRGPATGRAV